MLNLNLLGFFLFSHSLKAAAAATRRQQHDPILFGVTKDQAELSLASSYAEFCNEELIYAQLEGWNYTFFCSQ